MANFIDLASREAQGNLQIVVETPQGSGAKIKYNPLLETFELQRFIVSGGYPYGGYPYDWGFVPGTLAADGDPLDAMVIYEGHTWPGVIIPSVSIAVLKLNEAKAGELQTRQNDRVIAVPVADLARGTRPELTPEMRARLEQFFVSTGQLANKQISIQGWGNEGEATEVVAKAAQSYAARRGRASG